MTSQIPFRYPSILFLGDSLTKNIWQTQAGYSVGAAISNVFSGKFQIIERGFHGYNTANARFIANDVIPPTGSNDIKLLVLWFGANDAILPTAPQSQYIPIDKYKQNLNALIKSPNFQGHLTRGAKVIIVSPPPFNEHQGGTAGRLAKETRKYVEAAGQVAKDGGYEFLDLWSDFMKFAGWEEGDPLLGDINVASSKKLDSLLASGDGVHLTAAGYRRFYDRFRNITCGPLAEQICNAQNIFPDWQAAPRYESSGQRNADVFIPRKQRRRREPSN
ncbi:uncharacterized protein DFL_001612 [Arthrobotrys flagrans]|uniref:SGNH hydrolase-type esterase domain-containing protein n=1 Tax=Arthrobotrys flagrans TaxID=97331 RepID=A0A437A8E1_ARTFL|nr:hypothetical protein DFL_001612 [Arthrobotrys flagrans]